MALRAAESNEDAALGAMSHVSGSPTGSTETMSEAIGVLWNLPQTASLTEWFSIAILCLELSKRCCSTAGGS